MASHPADADELPIMPDIFLEDDDVLNIGDITLKVIHTPGHSPGSLCFLCGCNLISGDTIFEGGPGKSWTPEELNKIIMSITEKIFTLPDDTRIFHVHGNRMS
jgi:glyoxylase-like metal-dependent hydrolase (beta-lactamase superfamily II)